MVAELLIVDDDPAIRRMLGRTLAAEGYEVRVAADGGTALAELERSLPDVLVLDVAMPGIDGLRVAERVRAKGLQLPILFLTARDAVSDRVAGFDAGDTATCAIHRGVNSSTRPTGSPRLPRAG